jgi:PAS domain S-box-containing protein
MKTLSNSEGKFIYGSPSITKILGYELHEFIGKQFVNFVHSSSIQSLNENIELILQIPGSSFNFQYQLLHKNGEPIWCEGTVTNMLHDKSIQAYVSNFVDISEKKLAEQQKDFDENNLNALINY